MTTAGASMLAMTRKRLPLLNDESVVTDLGIRPRTKKPLTLDIPLLVSDMSFGARSKVGGPDFRRTILSGN